MLVSQPLDAAPSQLPQPDSHAIAQTPCMHDGVPWLELHCLPQSPQLVALLNRLVSQPFVLSASQSPKPAAHADEHVPAVQRATAFGYVGQARLQPPQCAGSFSRSASQPFDGSPSQSPNPVSHVVPHTPLTQLGAAFGPPGHTVPHWPQ
jgi:hypothetical protein